MKFLLFLLNINTVTALEQPDLFIMAPSLIIRLPLSYTHLFFLVFSYPSRVCIVSIEPLLQLNAILEPPWDSWLRERKAVLALDGYLARDDARMHNVRLEARSTQMKCLGFRACRVGKDIIVPPSPLLL
jgi:hypothetical protein